MSGIEILPGEYECFVDVWNNKQTRGWGERIARIGIRLLNSEETVFEQIGEIGVDAGLAGFYQDKPDFTDDEWSEFCDKVFDEDEREAHFIDGGVCSSSGYGDGGYGVYGRFNVKHGAHDVLCIRFIEDETSFYSAEDPERFGEDDEEEEVE